MYGKRREILIKTYKTQTGFWLSFRLSQKKRLSGFPLSRGTREVILTLSEKIPCGKEQFITSVKGSAILSAPILINFEGIVSTLMAFLTSIYFKSSFTSGAFICWKSKLFKPEPNLLLIFNNNSVNGITDLFYCVCLKIKTLSMYRFSPCSSTPRLFQNIKEFGAFYRPSCS